MIKDSKDPALFHFADVVGPGDKVCEEYKANRKSLKSSQTSIVIDNGSYQCRVGWANESSPQFVFRNASTRARGKKGEGDFLCVGNDIHSFEAARSNLKTPFDQNIVTNFACQEQILDYSFYHLGMSEESHILHPIVMMEPVCNPNYSRSMMSELLFECYNVPSLVYGVDAMYSLYFNGTIAPDVDINNGIVVSCGYQATHVLPIVDGSLNASRIRRLNIGGSHMVGFMHRLIQLKLPSLHHHVYPSRVQELVSSLCYTSLHYGEELVRWGEGKMDTELRRIQLPYYQSAAALEATADPNKEARDAERRRKAGERLRELNRKKKQEKVRALQQQVKDMNGLLEIQENDPEGFEDSIEAAGFSTYEDLVKAIAEANSTIEKLTLTPPPKAKGEEMEEEVSEEWLESLRARRSELLEKRQRRQLHRQELSQRRSAASSKRMKIISQLADDTITKKGKKQVKDTFGLDDDDWIVYKEISKDGGGSDSEKEEAEVQEIDKVLEKHDPKHKKPVVVLDPVSQSQLHLGVERCRVPEILYQPSMIGVDQEGLAEAIKNVLQLFTPEVQARMANNIFVTGGCSLLPNFEDRLRNEVTVVRPFQSSFKVWGAADKQLDGWRGAALWSKKNKHTFITKEDYDEKGGEYFKEHFASNQYIRTCESSKQY